MRHSAIKPSINRKIKNKICGEEDMAAPVLPVARRVDAKIFRAAAAPIAATAIEVRLPARGLRRVFGSAEG